jgi:hypothetical protein
MPKQRSKKRAEKRSITEYKDKVIPSVYKALCKGLVSADEVDDLLEVLEDHIEGMHNADEWTDEMPATILYQKLWLKDKLKPPSHLARLKDMASALEGYKDCFEEYPGTIYRLDRHINYLQWLADNKLKAVLRNKQRM